MNSRNVKRILICLFLVQSIFLTAIPAYAGELVQEEYTAPDNAQEEYQIQENALTTLAEELESETEAMTRYSEEVRAEAYNDRESYKRDLQAEDAYAARIMYTRELMSDNMALLSNTTNAIVSYAMSWVGVTPYVWAGRSLWYGTDCSGFVSLIYEHFGYTLPTGSDAYQYYVGRDVTYERWQPGDIVVYDYGAHVAIYAGDGLVIHCSSPENGTVVWEYGYRTVTKVVRIL